MSGSVTLPPGWALATLGDLADVQGGIQKQPKRAPRANAHPFLRVANVLRGRLDLSEVHEIELFGDELDRLRLEPGDLLVVEGNGSPAEIGRMAVWAGAIPECVHQNHIIRARPREGVDSRFVEAFWNSPDGAQAVRQVASSTTGLYTLSLAKVAGVCMPLAPVAEQRRIVAAIEEQFTRLDAAIGSLRRARANLRRYRSAVVSAAADGDLLLLEDGRLKDNHPGHDVSRARCRNVAIGELLIESPTNGRSVTDDPHGFPLLRLTALHKGRIDLSRFKLGALTPDEFRRFRVAFGDFFVSRGNGSLDLVGRGGLVETEPGDVAFPDTLIRIRTNPQVIDPRFLRLVWNGPSVRAQIERTARTTAGIYKINQQDLRRILVPLPSLSIQVKIVARAEDRLSVIDETEAAVEANVRRAERLRQAILKRAFEGKLVPQDPTDEPANTLLDRIRAERATINGTARATRRSSTRVKKTNTTIQEPLPL